MIVRPQTPAESKDFTDIYSQNNTKKKFYDEMTKKEQEAIKSEKPFAKKVALDDFNEHYEREVKNSMKKNGGYVKVEDIKPFKPDWDKYSNLDNFELVEEGEKDDTNLQNKNPGLNINIKWKKYKYKDYNYHITVMEDSSKAIKRAKGNLEELNETIKRKK